MLQAVDQVVALGGGTPMIAEARGRIESCQQAGQATVIYLCCEVGELVELSCLRPVLDGHILSLDPAEIAHLLHEKLTNRIGR